MTRVDVSQCTDELSRVPIIEPSSLNIREALDAVLENAELMGSDIELRVGAVWNRKGYPACGSVSAKVSPNPAYRTGTEDILISMTVLVPRNPWMQPKLAAFVTRLEAEAEAAKIDAEQKLIAAERQRIAGLREEADRRERALDS